MRLTPIDVQQQQFRKSFRGVDRREVQSFLDLVAQQMSELTRENNDLRSEVRRLERHLEEHRDREETLREAMLTAQRAIDEIREQAKKEAQIVVSDSELRAEKILHNAHCRVTKIVDDINDLRRQRTRAIEELRGILATHGKLIDTYEETTESHEGTVAVFERVRPPSPPIQDADEAEAAG
ncbi:DivIVA domain-containing protein [Myxococcota bacterium]